MIPLTGIITKADYVRETDTTALIQLEVLQAFLFSYSNSTFYPILGDKSLLFINISHSCKKKKLVTTCIAET